MRNGMKIEEGKTYIYCRFCDNIDKWLDETFDDNKSYGNTLPEFPKGWKYVKKSTIAMTLDEYCVCEKCYKKDRDFSTI